MSNDSGFSSNLIHGSSATNFRRRASLRIKEVGDKTVTLQVIGWYNENIFFENVETTGVYSMPCLVLEYTAFPQGFERIIKESEKLATLYASVNFNANSVDELLPSDWEIFVDD